MVLVNPGPAVTAATPMPPVNLATASAAKTADASKILDPVITSQTT